MHKAKNNKEYGNVMIVILVLVALVAGLTYAISGGMRGGEAKIGEDKARMMASEIIQYAGTIETSFKMMKIDGMDEDDLSFHADFWGHTDYEHTVAQPDEHKIFHPSGGGVNYIKPSDDLANGGEWVLTGATVLEWDDVSHTDTNAPDLVLMLTNVNSSVCEQINAQITGTASLPEEKDCFTLRKYTGAYTSTRWLTVPVANKDLAMGCIRAVVPCGGQPDDAPHGYNYFYALLVSN